MIDMFTSIVWGVLILSFLYVIILLNGRQFKYFRHILEEERKQNQYLFDILVSVFPKGSPDLPSEEPEVQNRRLRRTDKMEKDLSGLI